MYPGCYPDEPERLGNGECDDKYNTHECNYDGEDCETPSTS